MSIIALKPEGPDPVLVEFVEGLLEKVRSGEVVAVGVATVDRGNMQSTGWQRGDIPVPFLHYAAATLAAELLGVQMDTP